MIRRPPRSTLTDALFPYTTLFRSAASPERRLETIRLLAGSGIPVSVMVAPVIPALTDHELEAILIRARDAGATGAGYILLRSEEHTSELQSLMRISYAVFCLKKKNKLYQHRTHKTEKTYPHK